MQRTPRVSTSSLCSLLLGAIGASIAACGPSDRGGEGDDGGEDLATSDPGSGGGVPGSGGGSDIPMSTEELLLGFPGCTEPVPLIDGQDSGIYRCAEGHLWRHQSRSCPSGLPRDIELFPIAGSDMGGASAVTQYMDMCERDSDCPQETDICEPQSVGTWMYCEGTSDGPYFLGNTNLYQGCSHGCIPDDDCESHQVCVCGEDIGRCHDISGDFGCRTDADCGAGYQCMSNVGEWRPEFITFACQLPDDQCHSRADCLDSFSPNAACILGYPNTTNISARTCGYHFRGCGRPFVVEGKTRRADSRLGGDWAKSGVHLDAKTVPDDVKRGVIDHYSMMGLMEHASIAAFARFTLQLLSLGAPAHLIEASNAALVDETRHARLAFQVASELGGSPVAPGPIEMNDVLNSRRPEDILVTTIIEGCVGETLAALEASEAAAKTQSEVLRGVLATIASDEARHAALAWRTVAWMLGEFPRLRPLAEATFARSAPQQSDMPLPSIDTLRAENWGVLSRQTRQRIAEQAHVHVIRRCASALLDAGRDHQGTRSTIEQTVAATVSRVTPQAQSVPS